MKTCTKCGKPEGEVEFSSYERGTRMQKRPSCKECCRHSYHAYDATRRETKRAYNKDYYRANIGYFQEYNAKNKAARTTKIVAAHKAARHERYARIQARKEATPCADCARRFPYYVMDFDHRDPEQKVAGISALVRSLVPWVQVKAEIAKCDLVCACCHRLRTYRGQHAYKTRRYNHHRAVLDEMKSTSCCLDCGGSFAPCQMDFDHLRAKVANIACLVEGPAAQLQFELRKCHLVCANCHRIRGNTGMRPVAPEHSELLGDTFAKLLESTPLPEDQRYAPFPAPLLLGAIPDRLLSELSGVSRDMVAWYRRKAGIHLNRQGERVDSEIQIVGQQ